MPAPSRVLKNSSSLLVDAARALGLRVVPSGSVVQFSWGTAAEHRQERSPNK